MPRRTAGNAGPILDVAVIGGGVAGLYAAWRLAYAAQAGTKGPNVPCRNVCVFEAARKEGGRLVSANMPAMPFRAELGGMRFTERQLLFTSLLKELNLTSQPFRFETELYYLRGKHLSPGDKPPYALAEAEQGKSAIELVRHALTQAVRKFQLSANCPERRGLRSTIRGLAKAPLDNRTFSARQWEILKRCARLHRQPLHAIGFWNLLGFYLSNEAFRYARDSFGYQSILANWNAADAIPWFLRDFGVEYRMVAEGMDKVPTKLAYELSKLCPDSLRTRHTLVEIEIVKDTEHLLALSFKETEERVLTRAVILALPERALRAIRFKGVSEADQEHFHGLLESVTRHPLFKLFLGYARPWWHFPGRRDWTSGRAVTDLPIRQVYYFGPDKALKTTTRRAMVMASYSDAYYVDFWRPLHRSPIPGAYEDYYYAGRTLRSFESDILHGLGASKRMVRKAHRQICELHPDVRNIPKPLVALEREWPEGWHTWRVHYKSWEMMDKLTRPLNARIFICGEAYSLEQGWVEGALRSAELILSRELRLPAPAWFGTVDWSAEGFGDYDEYIGNWHGVEPASSERSFSEQARRPPARRLRQRRGIVRA